MNSFRLYRWGNHWGWMFSISRWGLDISTPIFVLKIARRTKWYGEKACLACGEGHSGAHPDPCLGELPGVRGSCCGHGDRTEAYIGWENGVTIREFLVDDGSWKLNMGDWVPEEANFSESVDVTIPIYVDAGPLTAEDYRSLGELVWEEAQHKQESRRNIHRAVYGRS